MEAKALTRLATIGHINKNEHMLEGGWRKQHQQHHYRRQQKPQLLVITLMDGKPTTAVYGKPTLVCRSPQNPISYVHGEARQNFALKNTIKHQQQHNATHRFLSLGTTRPGLFCRLPHLPAHPAHLLAQVPRRGSGDPLPRGRLRRCSACHATRETIPR